MIVVCTVCSDLNILQGWQHRCENLLELKALVSSSSDASRLQMFFARATVLLSLEDGGAAVFTRSSNPCTIPRHTAQLRREIWLNVSTGSYVVGLSAFSTTTKSRRQRKSQLPFHVNSPALQKICTAYYIHAFASMTEICYSRSSSSSNHGGLWYSYH